MLTQETNIGSAGNPANSGLYIQDSDLYREFLAEREEIMRHKWLESERAGYDIGFERALTDWRIRYRSKWVESRMKDRSSKQAPLCKDKGTPAKNPTA